MGIQQTRQLDLIIATSLRTITLVKLVIVKTPKPIRLHLRPTSALSSQQSRAGGKNKANLYWEINCLALTEPLSQSCSQAL